MSLTDTGRRYCEAVLVGLGALHEGAEEVAGLSGFGSPEVTLACTDEVSHLFAMQRFDALKAALGEEVRILARVGVPASLPPQPDADVLLTWDVENVASRHRVVITGEAIGAFCSRRAMPPFTRTS